MFPLIGQAKQYLPRTAVRADGRSFTYEELLQASEDFAAVLLDGASDLQEKRVAFMVEPGFDYVRVQWAIWRAGGIAVPLCTSYPPASLHYVIEDTGSEIVVASPVFQAVLERLAGQLPFRFIVLANQFPKNKSHLPDIDPTRRAMILYTSGTTNLPKGVVTTHRNLEAQITSLVRDWAYSETDQTICVLPLHHVHGIVNVVSCTLWAGGCVIFLPFSPEKIFNAFLSGEVNVFMAVPTIYFKLIAHWDALPDEEKLRLYRAMQGFRLMVSGSAALPVSVMEKWEQVSGHRLLERYGMTEIGMAISNPYSGERRAGHIGQPLSGVNVRLVDDEGQEVEAGQPGEIQVKGDTVFLEYWNRPEATRDAFTENGWFKTGDVAVLDAGYYRILGRSSIDIIKSGGYKISALEIEEVLRTHPAVSDCSVIGIPDEEWGELVAAVLVPVSAGPDLDELNTWIREKLPAYKIPRQYELAAELPRNGMGKVTKNELKKFFTT